MSKCKHKHIVTTLGWKYCVDCKEYLFAYRDTRIPTFCDRDGSDTPKIDSKPFNGENNLQTKGEENK